MNTNMFAVLLSDIQMAPNHTHWALKKSFFFLLRVRKRRASWCCGWKWRFISLTFDPWEMTRWKIGKCDSMSWQNDLRCTLFVYNRLDVIKTKNKNTLFRWDEFVSNRWAWRSSEWFFTSRERSWARRVKPSPQTAIWRPIHLHEVAQTSALERPENHKKGFILSVMHAPCALYFFRKTM